MTPARPGEGSYDVQRYSLEGSLNNGHRYERTPLYCPRGYALAVGTLLAVTRYISAYPGPIEPRHHPLSRFVHAQMCAEQMCMGHEQNLRHVRSRYHQLLYYLPLAHVDPVQQPPLSAEVGVGQVAH